MPRPFRLLHTADWHIGKTLFGLSLLADQRHVLRQLLDHVRAQRPDVVVVAGDIYDRSVPPAEAIALLDETLTELVAELQTPVVLIAGNHDGPERLGFGATLLQRAGLTIRGPVDLDAPPIRFQIEGLSVVLCPLPYAEPVAVRSQLSESQRQSIPDHAAALRRQIQRMKAQLQPQDLAVAVAHAFVQGAKVVDQSAEEYSDVERCLSVGGSALVQPSVFDGFTYAALGHLHSPQWVGAARRVRYSGSLLQYSFAEANQARSATLLEIAADGSLQSRDLPLQPQRPLRTIRGTLAELLAQGSQDPKKLDFISATLLDPGVLLDPLGRLRKVYPNVLHIDRPQLQAGSGALLQGDHRQRQPLDIVSEFWQSVRGEDLGADAQAVLLPVLDRLTNRHGEQA